MSFIFTFQTFQTYQLKMDNDFSTLLADTSFSSFNEIHGQHNQIIQYLNSDQMNFSEEIQQEDFINELLQNQPESTENNWQNSNQTIGFINDPLLSQHHYQQTPKYLNNQNQEPSNLVQNLYIPPCYSFSNSQRLQTPQQNQTLLNTQEIAGITSMVKVLDDSNLFPVSFPLILDSYPVRCFQSNETVSTNMPYNSSNSNYMHNYNNNNFSSIADSSNAPYFSDNYQLMDTLDDEQIMSNVTFQTNGSSINQNSSASVHQFQSSDFVEPNLLTHSHSLTVSSTVENQIPSTSADANIETKDDGKIEKVKKKKPAQKNTSGYACVICTQTVKPVGYFYGAFVCEACKKYFERNLKKKPAVPLTCVTGNFECIITPIQRDCRGCRAMRCLNFGMCKDSKIFKFEN